jgi:hypothetical protein
VPAVAVAEHLFPVELAVPLHLAAEPEEVIQAVKEHQDPLILEAEVEELVEV